MYLVLFKLVVYGHGRGTRLNTCLVLEPCIVCREFATCVNVSICRVCMGMDEASDLVRALWSIRVCLVP